MGYSQDEWTPLIIHEKMAGNWDAQSHDPKIEIKSKIIANKTPPGLLLVKRYPLFRTSHGMCSLVVGEYKLYHSVWEPPVMYVAWKISKSLGCYVDNESMPPKNIIYLCFKTRALAPLQIPTSLCEGPIYLLLC